MSKSAIVDWHGAVKRSALHCCTVGLLAQHSAVAAGSWALHAANSRCDDSTQQLSIAAAAAQDGDQNEGRGGRWQRCGSYGGARQTGGRRQACFVKVEGTLLHSFGGHGIESCY